MTSTIDQIQFVTGAEMNPVGNGRIVLVLRPRTVELAHALHGSTRRWTADLLPTGWQRFVNLLAQSGFPQPVASSPRLPGMDATEIVCTSDDVEERVCFHDSPGPYLEVRKLAYNLLAQIAPGVMPEPPWTAPVMVENAREQ